MFFIKRLTDRGQAGRLCNIVKGGGKKAEEASEGAYKTFVKDSLTKDRRPRLVRPSYSSRTTTCKRTAWAAARATRSSPCTATPSKTGSPHLRGGARRGAPLGATAGRTGKTARSKTKTEAERYFTNTILGYGDSWLDRIRDLAPEAGTRDRGGSAEPWNTDGMDLVALVMASVVRRPIIVWRYSFVYKAAVHEDPYRVVGPLPGTPA